MRVRLVLVSAPVSMGERYGLFSGAGSTEPSFGLLSLAAVARQAGATVKVIESSARGLDPELTLKEILEFSPHCVGFSATTSDIIPISALAARVKTVLPQVLTLIGGCHVTALPEETLNAFPALDLAVLGEGEETLREVLGRLEAGDHFPDGIAGTARRAGTVVRRYPARDLIANLDTLPLPAWDLLEGFPSLFKPSPSRIRRWPCASIVLTRGCPNQCKFCDRSVFGNQCRAYSPEYAVSLVRDLYDRYGVRELLIEDDTFVIVKERVREFCERLIQEKLKISWSCLGRADRVDPDLLRLMRRAGCWQMSYGIESGDPEILKAMCKRLDLDQIRQAILWSRKAGLRTKGFFIVGFPGETLDSLERTRRFACSLPLDDITVMQMTPFPGSELYSLADQAGMFDRDWRKMNIVNTVFVPHGLTQEGLESARSRLLRDFYFRPEVLWRQALHIGGHPRLWKAAVSGFCSLLRVVRGA
jgi:radical SAM superfamily enzyme YgiQ (UPF0313 family)